MLNKWTMFFAEKRRSLGTACKSAIALAVLPIWLVSMSYCSLAPSITCKPDPSSHEAHCHGHSADSYSDSHSSKSEPTSKKSETCCDSVKTLVSPASNVVVQPPPFSHLLWILSDISLLHFSGPSLPAGFSIYDHRPPGSPIILFSLRHSHQENAPPQSV